MPIIDCMHEWVAKADCLLVSERSSQDSILLQCTTVPKITQRSIGKYSTM